MFLRQGSYVDVSGFDSRLLLSNGNDLADIYITPPKFFNQMTLPPQKFKIVYLSHVVNYAKQSEEKNMHVEHCFFVQTKTRGVVYWVHCSGNGEGNQLLKPPSWKGTWLWYNWWFYNFPACFNLCHVNDHRQLENVILSQWILNVQLGKLPMQIYMCHSVWYSKSAQSFEVQAFGCISMSHLTVLSS